MSLTVFTDFYSLMRLPVDAEVDTIERVYQLLAARFDPSQPASGDAELFALLQQARQVLTDPKTRADYDARFASQEAVPIPLFATGEFGAGETGERNRRLGLLCVLYHWRRKDHEKAGLSLLFLESITTLPREHLIFSLSYLREKEYVLVDQLSNFGITAKGMDYVEGHVSADSVFGGMLRAAERGQLRSYRPGTSL